MLKDDGVFRAYECQGGALPDLSHVGKDFLPEFAEYLRVNGLTNLLGLQVLGCGSTSMSELILEGETVMVDGSALMGCEEPRTGGVTRDALPILEAGSKTEPPCISRGSFSFVSFVR